MHRVYSRLFHTLYDERSPVGFLGRGTHHSVLEYATSVDCSHAYLPNPWLHRFAIIWDEDHDIRVIHAVEQLFLKRMLSRVLALGERKGNLTILVHNEDCKPAIESIADSLMPEYDPWSYEVTPFEFGGSSAIINAADDRVQLYLTNLKSQWRLGSHDLQKLLADEKWNTPGVVAAAGPYLEPVTHPSELCLTQPQFECDPWHKR